MGRLKGLALSLVVAACIVAGAAAATRTAHLGQAATEPQRVPDTVLAARRAKLDRVERSLRKAQDARPPALPRVPHFAPVPVPAPLTVRALASDVAPAPAPAAPARTAPAAEAPVTYEQSPPVVTYVQQQPSQGTSGSEEDDGAWESEHSASQTGQETEHDDHGDDD